MDHGTVLGVNIKSDIQSDINNIVQ